MDSPFSVLLETTPERLPWKISKKGMSERFIGRLNFQFKEHNVLISVEEIYYPTPELDIRLSVT
jgi:hypothetical protein